jgi:dTMP kinase
MFFIVFEGLDGSGKSSLMSSLANHLESYQQKYIRTREPGGTPLGDQIRELILTHSFDQAPCARAELLLYEASRAQHVEKVIRPALANKQWVLCDRYSASSVAFQGGGREISVQDVVSLNDFATTNLRPHLTVLLDLSVEASQNRRAQRSFVTGQKEDRIESEKNDFHERVRQSFLTQARQAPEHWLVLDANRTQEQLFQDLLKTLKGRQWLP